MPRWLCQDCRWSNEKAAETCTQCKQSTRDGDLGMTDGFSSEKEEDSQTPLSDEVPQEYELGNHGGTEEDGEDSE